MAQTLARGAGETDHGTVRPSRAAERPEAGPAQAAGQSNFFAIVSRVRYIERWALMRSSCPDDLAEHSLEVAMIAHALCELGNARHGRHLDAARAAVLGLYHDAPEIITGDLPTPVKYHDPAITTAYKAVEASAAESLLATLPDDLRDAYEAILRPTPSDDEDAYLLRLVKAADKISALAKCVVEVGSGNSEFRSAEASTRAVVEAMALEMPEVGDFVEEFLPGWGSTLDELL